MRVLPGPMVDALASSTPDARLRVNVFYDGELVVEDLGVSDWSADWSMGPQTMIQGELSLTVVDESGRLAPWGYDEPLSVAGSEVQCFFDVGAESVEYGWWVITNNAPQESWRMVTVKRGRFAENPDVVLVPGGSQIPVKAEERTRLVQDSRFMSPEAPADQNATVFTEIRRLLDGIMGVVFTGVSDRGVPMNMIYNEERVNTVYDLAHMVGEVRVTAEGLLEVFDPSRPAVPHWAIAPGDRGTLIDVVREQSRDRLYNAVVAESQDTETEVREWATLNSGPLRFDGPLGRKPMFKTSPASLKYSVRQDAESTLENEISGTTILRVTCTPNPAYELGDWGQIAAPVIGGKPFPLVGKLVSKSEGGSTSGLGEMALELECSTADVAAVARYVRGQA